MYKNKRGIALLITLFFIMLISVSIGVGLKHTKESAEYINNTEFIYQSSIALDDVLNILKGSQEIEKINSAEALSLLLAESSLIPFTSGDIDVTIEMLSARSKVNPIVLRDIRSEEGLLAEESEVKDALRVLFMNRVVSTDFANILFDFVGGVKVDGSYNTDIFNTNPYLFRDSLFSLKHLDAIKNIYKKKYHDNSINNIDLSELFYTSTSQNTGYKIDVNYATELTWEMMLGCSKERARFLVENVFVTKLEELDLSPQEFTLLQRFQVSVYEPFIKVKVKVTKRDMQANISFEYNLKTKKGSNFVFEI